MTNAEQIQSIDINIKQATAMVEQGNALERLRANRDFKKVIMEGYFEKEAVRLVHLKSDVAMQTPASQESIIRQMDAIGSLNSYFQTVFHSASLAKKAIEADEQTRAELLMEDGE